MGRLLLVCASLILPLAVLWAQDDSLRKFKLSGTVVNSVSGEPVGRALVEFHGAENRNVMAGADGHFEVDGLTGGDAFVSARRPGFAPPTQEQRIVIGSSTDSVTVKLAPLARISGTVRDKEGEPIEGITVQCLHQTIMNGRMQWQWTNGANTDETGHFLIEDLEPGSYLLHSREVQLYHVAQQKSEAARYVYPATFYPDAATREMAQHLQLAPGDELKADMTLQSIRAARVSFTTVPRYPNVMGTITRADEYPEIVGPQIDPSGEFIFAAVPPGSWKIVARSAFAGPKQQGSQEQLVGELAVDVGTTDIEHLKIPLSKLSDIPVQVTGAGGAAQVFVTLASKDGQMQQGSSPDTGGVVRIPDVSPGTYRVVAHANSSNVCITSIMSGSQDLMREELVVAAGSAPSIQVVQSDKCASLTITANQNGEAKAIITSNLRGFEPRLTSVLGQSSPMPGFAPGEYTVYAFDDITDLEYANPEAMRDFKSQTVVVEAGQTATVQVEVNERHAR
jgi:hypothetical protein